MLRNSNFEEEEMLRVSVLLLALMTVFLLSCQESDTITGSDSGEATISRVLQRPISDFIDAQGTTNIWQPYGDEIAWSENANQFDTPNAGWFDWLGFANEYFVANGGPDLGTVITGNVTERPIPGGRSVHVTLHGENVMAWAFDNWLDPDYPNPWADKPLAIGAREDAVFAGATPALGECNFLWAFTDTNPVGSALPDLVYTFNVGPWQDPPDYWPYMDWATQLHFDGSATGALHEASGWPEGTPGEMHISQVAHLSSPSHSPNFDGFPVERVMYGPLSE